MNIIDRINNFKEKIENYFISNKSLEWIDINISNIKRIDITSISYKNEHYNDSRKFVEDSLKELNEELENDKKLYIGFINLYTPEEAEMLNIKKTNKIKEGNFTFASVIEENINGEKYSSKKSDAKKGKIISFYSYKGGVGRTIALIQTAYLLADKGKKVAIIDLDIEAPSFKNIFKQSIRSKEGLVNYLYKKMYDIKDEEPIYNLKMVTKLNIGTSGEVYVVPAGELDLEYVKMLEGLKEKRIYENGYILEFIKELTKRYNLDYVLLDSRTGINNWGALSITDIADEVFLLAYPNEENISGTNLILDIIKERKKCTVVFSRIDPSEAGIEKARKLFKKINTNNQEFIGITYDTAVALTDKFPIENRAMQYKEISEFILEDEEIFRKRQWILENREFVLKCLENLSNGIYLDKVTTKLESKIVEEQNSIIVINEESNVKNIINIEKSEDYEIYEFNIEKYIKIFDKEIYEGFERDINEYINNGNDVKSAGHTENLKLLLTYIISLISEDKVKVKEILNEIKEEANKFDFIEKIKSELNGDIKRSYCIIDINKLLESISFKEHEEEKKIIILNDLIDAMDILVTCDIKIKLVVNYKVLKKYEVIFNNVLPNILNLNWNGIDKDLIKENIKEVLNEIYKAIKIDLKENDKDLNYLFPKRIEENKYSKKLEEWLTDSIIYKMHERAIGKEFILELIKEAAKIELNNNKEKNSIISFESIKKASDIYS
ncbi:MAG: AAA family ATPase [Clostridium sp.]|nr:AAA family ATPase [Clostridium sp.]MCI7441906.1 AAA family ATPase [Clostridium sp.]